MGRARGDRWKRLRETSKTHELAIELRVSLILVCALGALATVSHVSVLLAGFAGVWRSPAPGSRGDSPDSCSR